MTSGFVQYQEKKLEEARNEGIERGIEQGIEQGVLRSARALLDILSDKEISERLDIPISKVQALRAENRK